MARQHGQLAHDQRQLAVRRVGEGEAHAARRRTRDRLHVGVILAEERMPLLAQRLEGPDDVIGGDRFAVVPARLGAQGELDPRAVLRHVDGFGQQAVFGERLVLRADHERVVDQAERRGDTPLRMNPLKLSYVPMAASVTAPPFGASGSA